MTLSRLQTFYGTLSPHLLLSAMIKDEFAGKIALFSSFGADSALLISMVAEIDPSVPVLFLETRKHFPDTLEYVEQMRRYFGLMDLRLLTPDAAMESRIDPEGTLWKTQPNRCCWMRKVEPLQREIKRSGFEALITGRKAYQTEDRASMEMIELFEDGTYRINPLTHMSKQEIKGEFGRRRLPQHPLVEKGYRSIGCEPCTRPVKEGENERAGRWAHTAEMPGAKKTECGIHLEQKDADWTV